MSNKTNILTKELVNGKLQSLHFTFEEHYWQSYLDSDIEIKQHDKPAFSGLSPKLLAIPIVAVIAVLVIYFSVNSAHSQNNSKDNSNAMNEESTSVQNSLPAASLTSAEIQPEVKEETKPSESVVNTVNIPASNNEVVSNSNNPPAQTSINTNQNHSTTTNTARVSNQTNNNTVSNTDTAENKTSDTNPTPDNSTVASTGVNEKKTDTSSYKPIPASQYLKKKHKKAQKLEMPEASPEDDNIVIPEN